MIRICGKMIRKQKKLAFLRSKARLLFRILLAIGFVVQSMKFLELYLTYPYSVELEVMQPQDMELPAVTVCNVNEIRSTAYCNRYPHHCGLPDTKFCISYPEYCHLINESKIVPRLAISDLNLSRYEQQLLGHTYGGLVVRCTVEIDADSNDCRGDPILVPALGHSYAAPFNCYMLFSMYGKPQATPEKVPVSTTISLHLNIEVSEYHPYHLSRGAQISIHSPYHVPSPISEGQFLNMGEIYRFYVSMSNKELLPAPYKSNCTDYVSQWRANGGMGPVTQRMCIEKCKLDKSMAMYQCAEIRIDYPHNETYCRKAKPKFPEKVRNECFNRCSSPCNMTRFQFHVQAANSEGNRKSCQTSTDLSCATIVHIFFENLEVTTFSYKPLFESVGVLSWVGGYVGLWLGISLLTIYDFLEVRLFRVISMIRHRVRQRNRCDGYALRVRPDPEKRPRYQKSNGVWTLNPNF